MQTKGLSYNYSGVSKLSVKILYSKFNKGSSLTNISIIYNILIIFDM